MEHKQRITGTYFYQESSHYIKCAERMNGTLMLFINTS